MASIPPNELAKPMGQERCAFSITPLRFLDELQLDFGEMSYVKYMNESCFIHE